MTLRKTNLSVPELGLIAMTRAMLGAGLGLLLGDKLSAEQRKATGWTLLLVGAITTIPLGFEIFGQSRLDRFEPEDDRM